MSTLESIIWHVLGYSAIPVIVVFGIAVSALAFFILVNIFAKDGDD